MGLEEIHGFCPSITRATVETAEKLWKEGHEIVEFKVSWAADMIKVFSNMIFQVATGSFARKIRERGDSISPNLKITYDLFLTFPIVTKVIHHIANHFG